jgi:hypothetical protein
MHPLGRWLEDDLILASLEASDYVASRAAESLSIPESTIRRKILRIREQSSDGQPLRIDAWAEIQPLVRRIIPVARSLGVPAVELVTRLLITQIRAITSNASKGARLAGVSVPTFNRLVSQLY